MPFPHFQTFALAVGAVMAIKTHALQIQNLDWDCRMVLSIYWDPDGSGMEFGNIVLLL